MLLYAIKTVSIWLKFAPKQNLVMNLIKINQLIKKNFLEIYVIVSARGKNNNDLFFILQNNYGVGFETFKS